MATAEFGETTRDLNVGQIGSAVAAVTPDKTALTDGTTTLTFGELDRRVSSLTSGLLALGINKGDVVSAYLPNCIAYVIVVLGVARAGAVFSPINPRLTATEVTGILSLARPRAIFTMNECTDLVCQAIERASADDTQMVPIDMNRHDGGVPFNELCTTPHASLPVVSADDYFSLMFTSGTTGQPKGVLATHRARMVWLHKAIGVYGLCQEDVYLGVMPQVHSAGLTFTLMHLHVGGRVHIQRDFDPAEYLALIGQEQVTSSLVVPTVLVMVLEALEQARNQNLGSLRRLVTCGSPLQPTTKEGVLNRITPNLFDYYGSTESNSMTVLGPDDQRRKPNSVGPPFEGVEIRITSEQGEIMPTGEVGEVRCLNPSVMSRYLHDDNATAAAFTDGWFHTGDLGYVDADGYLYLVGRSKEVIISGGVNIHPAEVEQVLMSHFAVLDCAIIGLPDMKWGQIVTACIIPRKGAQIDLPSLQAHCAIQLADYKKPRRLVKLDEIPRNVGGKTLRMKLVENVLNASPE